MCELVRVPRGREQAVILLSHYFCARAHTARAVLYVGVYEQRLFGLMVRRDHAEGWDLKASFRQVHFQIPIWVTYSRRLHVLSVVKVDKFALSVDVTSVYFPANGHEVELLLGSVLELFGPQVKSLLSSRRGQMRAVPGWDLVELDRDLLCPITISQVI